MAECFSLRIGGVGVNVGCDVPVILDPSDTAYSGFISEARSVATDGLEVTVVIDDPNPPESASKVWDADGAWALFRRDRRRVITGPRHISAWSAEMHGGRVTVRCGDAMVRRDGGRVVVENPVRYPLDQLLLMYTLAERRGVIVHACGAEFAGKGALFFGRSGAGKSTLARLLVEAGGCTVLSDDRMIVRVGGRGAEMYGTPWPGEAGMAINRSVSVAACFVLEKATENRIEDLPSAGVADALWPVASVPWYEPETAASVLETCGDLASAVPLRVLRFRKDADAVAMVREAVGRGGG
jgi:hypothetical protein